MRTSNGHTRVLGTSSNARNKRGKSRSLKTLAIKDGEQKEVKANDYDQLWGDNRAEYATYLGVLVRSPKDLPVNYADWRYVPKSYKVERWSKLLEKYSIPKVAQKFVYKQMGTLWRNYKLSLKRHALEKYGNLDDARAHCVDDVPPEQWVDLISIWQSEKKQEISTKNKRNREAQTMYHTAGRKAFAQIYEDERSKNPEGERPSRYDMFFITRTREDGTAVDPSSEIKMALLKDEMSQVPPESRKDVDVVDEVLREELGHESHGRVRCLGLGVSPRQVSLTESNVKEKERLKEFEKKIREEVWEGVQQQLAERERMWERMFKERERMWERMFEERERMWERRLADLEQPRKDIVENLQSQVTPFTQPFD